MRNSKEKSLIVEALTKTGTEIAGLVGALTLLLLLLGAIFLPIHLLMVGEGFWALGVVLTYVVLIWFGWNYLELSDQRDKAKT